MIEETLSYLILGVVQGLTEFLPVSSSGHLTLFSELLGIKSDDITFKVLVHFATALSTIIVFRKDISHLTLEFFRKTEDGDKSRNYILFLVLSAMPAALVGFTLKDSIEALDYPQFVGYMLIATALILLASQKLNSNLEKKLGVSNSILIGISQAFAILPGISRSGSTIGTALLIGISRAEATKFSFLMALPVIMGATLLETKNLLEVGVVNSGPIFGYVLGVVSAFLSGLLACKLMIKLVKNTNLMWFSVYCGIMGLVAIFT
mgnify:CR=1 FL=1